MKMMLYSVATGLHQKSLSSCQHPSQSPSLTLILPVFVHEGMKAMDHETRTRQFCNGSFSSKCYEFSIEGGTKTQEILRDEKFRHLEPRCTADHGTNYHGGASTESDTVRCIPATTCEAFPEMAIQLRKCLVSGPLVQSFMNLKQSISGTGVSLMGIANPVSDLKILWEPSMRMSLRQSEIYPAE
ncbi:uncharacterized protein CLUP02_06435 [Colletotrichum lupini]|uniref:Uncharacterized protein n=1 Tax=Colletotrichum lupini TaxID=145971 RepID=A0A9Q8WF15_9PEZI|nr:uncharacterized protein CLUP02_06435 [Colletotrichum lupini]UQC80949.1 hypothetical protein CLUP02_06435 [Colletotrichum lupini]